MAFRCKSFQQCFQRDHATCLNWVEVFCKPMYVSTCHMKISGQHAKYMLISTQPYALSTQKAWFFSQVELINNNCSLVFRQDQNASASWVSFAASVTV